ncbi:MAG: hypothetical protein KGQ41_05435 [Alphaproteobacteria bacterium]|nr:hypothetical protein [Alphaproteobacteria bacterium]
MMGFFKSLFTKPLLQEAKAIVPAREDAPAIFARLFSSDDGQKVLSYLRASVNARVAGPEASEAVLRYCDGQRALLQTIHGLVEQGRN